MKYTFYLRLFVAVGGFLSAHAPLLALAQVDDGEIIVEEEDVEDDSEDTSTADDGASADNAAPPAAAPPAAAPPAAEDASSTDDSAPAAEGIAAEKEPSEVSTSIMTAPPAAPRDDDLLVDQAVRAALVDAPKREDSLSPITFSTSTFSRFEYREGYDDLGVSRGRFMEGDAVVFRARLGMRTNPLPVTDGSDVLVHFTPQASGIWGNNTVGEVNLGLYEGYLLFRSERLNLQLGRLKMNYGEALVIGDLDWHQAGRAFDGARVQYRMDKGYLDLFFTQVASGTSTSGPRFFAGDDVFWGAYLGIGEYLGEKLDLDAYFLGFSNFVQDGLTDEETGDTYSMDGAHLFTGGLRAKQKIGFFDYRIEGGVQFGRTVQAPPSGFTGSNVDAAEALAYQVDLELGATIASRTRLAVGAVLASGDDPNTAKNEGYNELYPTGHKFLGLMDIIGARTNVGSANVKLSQSLGDSFKAQIDGHVFTRLEAGGLGSVAGSGLAGTEFDLQLSYALGKYARIRGLYGLFIPASGHYASDDLAHYVEVEAGLAF